MKKVNLGLIKKDYTQHLNKYFFSRYSDKLFPTGKETVLDVGCGNMKVREYLPIDNYIGLDKESYSEDAPILVSSVDSIPLPSNSVDVVLSLGFPFWQIGGGTSEVRRVMKKDGWLVMRFSSFYNLIENPEKILVSSGFAKESGIQLDYEIKLERMSSVYLTMKRGD